MKYVYCGGSLALRDISLYWVSNTYNYSDYVILDVAGWKLLSKFCKMSDLLDLYNRTIDIHWEHTTDGLCWDNKIVVQTSSLVISLDFIVGVDNNWLLAFSVGASDLCFLLVKRRTLEFVASYSNYFKCVNSELFAPYIVRLKEIAFSR